MTIRAGVTTLATVEMTTAIAMMSDTSLATAATWAMRTTTGGIPQRKPDRDRKSMPLTVPIASNKLKS